jgi:hypothetical protein
LSGFAVVSDKNVSRETFLSDWGEESYKASHGVPASDMWDCAKHWSCWRLHGAGAAENHEMEQSWP